MCVREADDKSRHEETRRLARRARIIRRALSLRVGIAFELIRVAAINLPGCNSFRGWYAPSHNSMTEDKGSRAWANRNPPGQKSDGPNR